MKSCIYRGRVRHRRYAPRSHQFSYSLFMVYLDLAELDQVFKGRWLWSTRRFNLAWLRRRDHVGDPRQPLDAAVRDLVETETGRRPDGPIRLLTHLRYFGYCFNPVSFYYCFDRDDRRVETIVAEVNNTPWNERHCYVLPAQGRPPQRVHRHRFSKAFHVSPFMPLQQSYDWRLSEPGELLAVHMENHEGEGKKFDATLRLERVPISAFELARTLFAFPFMTGKVIAGIYFEALRLWLKRTPFFSHPAHDSEQPPQRLGVVNRAEAAGSSRGTNN